MDSFSAYADLRSASLPRHRTASTVSKYHTKLSGIKRGQRSLPNTSTIAYGPHWTSSTANAISMLPPDSSDQLSKRQLYKESQLLQQMRTNPAGISYAAAARASPTTAAAASAAMEGARQQRHGQGWKRESMPLQSEGDDTLSLSMLSSSVASVEDTAASSRDMAAEISVLRGRDTADVLVDGALRKWKKERKAGVEKMGWDIVLENENGESSAVDRMDDAEEGWEVLADL